MNRPRILYCHCAYAQVVPKEVKEAVLRRLSEAGIAFEAVADLCELSARRDRTLQRLASEDPADGLKIAACFPRAVKWLFAAAASPLNPHATEIVNMRVQSADEVIQALLANSLQPNLPADKSSAATPDSHADASMSNEPKAQTSLNATSS
jgi:heterodisulfide reductase subunit A-like polyferredoxin